MLYRLLTVDQAAALPRAEYERLVFPNDACLLPATDEERDATLGFVARSSGWNAESWQSAAVSADGCGLYGLANMCLDMARALMRQEAEHGEDGV